jgi:hypothetical protein
VIARISVEIASVPVLDVNPTAVAPERAREESSPPSSRDVAGIDRQNRTEALE